MIDKQSQGTKIQLKYGIYLKHRLKLNISAV